MKKQRGDLDRRWKNAQKPWTDADLEYLDQKYGLLSLKGICRYLGRSPNAIKVASVRKLHHGMKISFYTSQQLAEILLGSRHACKTIVYYMNLGWLSGRKSYARAGKSVAWCFFEKDILSLLRTRPWLCNLKRMERHYFRSVVQEEYDKDPWYTCDEAAPMLGVKSPDAVQRYIKKKWLLAEKCPGGPWQGQWIIRLSAIQEFLANDPRPTKQEYVALSKRKLRFDRGLPVRLSIHWSVRCRFCGQRILVMAPPSLKAPRVEELLHNLYTNGHCSHGLRCTVDLKMEKERSLDAQDNRAPAA